jgi:hypothetical protein
MALEKYYPSLYEKVAVKTTSIRLQKLQVCCIQNLTAVVGGCDASTYLAITRQDHMYIASEYMSNI